MGENTPIKNIQTLFEHAQSYNIRIPEYQRSYSWGEKQRTQFLEDLYEQNGKPYYLGQFLFEKEGQTLYIIDGQQRLTTTVLFFAALAKVKKSRNLDVQVIENIYLTTCFDTIEQDYLLFKNLKKGNVADVKNIETASQRRLIETLNYFEKELTQQSDEMLNTLEQTLANAVVSTFYVPNKIEATQIFEYQNDIGEVLSNFEKIKAYLVNQIYLHSEDNAQANTNIQAIQKEIAQIYRNLEAAESYFSEYELLNTCCRFFFDIGGNLSEVKSKLKEVEDKDKLPWITTFFEEFQQITYHAASVVGRIHNNEKDKALISNLFLLGQKMNWKYVLLVLFYKGVTETEEYLKILKLLEIFCFKMNTVNYSADYLLGWAKWYLRKDVYIHQIYESIKSIAEEGFKRYWGLKNAVGDFLNETLHYNYRRATKYILWQYENHLRAQYHSGMLMDEKHYDKYTIEHICPQNPQEEAHNEEFQENFLHLLGNLNLLTQSQNSKYSNKPFEEKKELYQDTTLLSYKEIRSQQQWSETEITERRQRIVAFAQEYLNTNNY